MTDRITEHYQENPEGARLVSVGSDEPHAGKSRSATASAKKKSGKSSKSAVSGKSEKITKKADPADTNKAAGEKKSASKKPAQSSGKNAGKSAANAADVDENGEQSQSVKTPSVMRLVEERAFEENQVVAAGKSLIPRQLRGIEPLSKVMRREAEFSGREQQTEPDDEVSRSPLVMRELTGMVIAECVPGILSRFNACDCERCASELARLTAEEIPARYMRLPELADLSWSGFSDDERLLIDSLKKNVVTVMIRLMIANKKRNFHG